MKIMSEALKVMMAYAITIDHEVHNYKSQFTLSVWVNCTRSSPSLIHGHTIMVMKTKNYMKYDYTRMSSNSETNACGRNWNINTAHTAYSRLIVTVCLSIFCLTLIYNFLSQFSCSTFRHQNLLPTTYFYIVMAAPQLKRLVAGFPPRRPGFKPGSDK
jgi:hypothetical protein